MSILPVRSRRFFGPIALVAATNTDLYTVEDERTAIFHAITIVNNTVTAAILQLRVNGNLAADNVFIATMPGSSSADLIDRIILNPGDVLSARSQVGTTVSIAGFGSLLNGAPS